jgi:hypothetical protein
MGIDVRVMKDVADATEAPVEEEKDEDEQIEEEVRLTLFPSYIFPASEERWKLTSDLGPFSVASTARETHH